MREEITEPKHWRAASETRGKRNSSWTSRPNAHVVDRTELAAEVVDAALADAAEASNESQELDSTHILSSLAKQLDLLEKQRHQIQLLLDQAQGN